MQMPQGVASLALGYVLHWAFSPPLLNPKLEFRILMYGKTPKRAFNAFALSGRVFKIGIKSATVFVAF
jgi:hypothetical protein